MNSNQMIGQNITQTLFKQDEKTIVPSDSVSLGFQNLSAISGINSMPEEINNMQNQMPAYINQAHLSTFYQDNPWDILMFSKKYGLQPMGGNIETNKPPGHKPGNILVNGRFKNNDNIPSINSAQKTREYFGNIDEQIKINWN